MTVEVAVGQSLAGPGGVVVCARPEAARAGAEVLLGGGNAVDAAVAAALALTVVDPMNCGIGGYGGYLVACPAGSADVRVVDFNTLAPRGVEPGDEPAQAGGRAVAVPAALAGLAGALERLGTIGLDRALQPAIDLAEGGFVVGELLARAARSSHLDRFPETARLIRGARGRLAAGDRLAQPELGGSLRAIAERGPDVLYRGPLGERLVAAVAADGGRLGLDDLAAYAPRVESAARAACGGGWEVAGPPLGTSGSQIVLESLRLLDGLLPAAGGPQEPGVLHLLLEALKLAWADRLGSCGDSPRPDRPTAEELLAAAHLARQRARLQPDRSAAAAAPGPAAAGPARPGLPTPEAGRGQGGLHTTHLSVGDRWGGQVALTFTHGPLWFGSGLSVPGTGIVLNNGLSLFEPAADSPNRLAPGRRPLVNLAPTLVLRQGRGAASLGTPGGRRIPTTVARCALAFMRGADLEAAIALPRVHVEAEEPLRAEPELSGALRRALLALGHHFGPDLRFADFYGPAGGVWLDAAGTLRGAADRRGQGAVAACA